MIGRFRNSPASWLLLSVAVGRGLPFGVFAG